MAQDYPVDEARPRRRGRKLLIGLFVLLLLLAGLLVVADRVAVGVAERMIGDRVRQEIAKQGAQSAAARGGGGRHSRSSPRCSTAVTSGSPSTCGTCRPPVEGDAVRLPVLDVTARNVRASLDTLRTGQGDVVADTVNGAGTISYESLAALLNRPGLTLGEQNGKLAVTGPGRHPRSEAHHQRHRRRHRRRQRRGRPAVQRPGRRGSAEPAAGSRPS